MQRGTLILEFHYSPRQVKDRRSSSHTNQADANSPINWGCVSFRVVALIQVGEGTERWPHAFLCLLRKDTINLRIISSAHDDSTLMLHQHWNPRCLLHFLYFISRSM